MIFSLLTSSSFWSGVFFLSLGAAFGSIVKALVQKRKQPLLGLLFFLSLAVLSAALYLVFLSSFLLANSVMLITAGVLLFLSCLGWIFPRIVGIPLMIMLFFWFVFLNMFLRPLQSPQPEIPVLEFTPVAYYSDVVTVEIDFPYREERKLMIQDSGTFLEIKEIRFDPGLMLVPDKFYFDMNGIGLEQEEGVFFNQIRDYIAAKVTDWGMLKIRRHNVHIGNIALFNRYSIFADYSEDVSNHELYTLRLIISYD